MQSLSAYEFTKLAGLVKASQLPEHLKRKHKHDRLSAAYPAYDRSLLAQFTSDPRQAGTSRAISTGLVAAVLGPGRPPCSRDPKVVGGTALGAGALGQFLVIYQGNGKLNLRNQDSASRFPDI